MKTNRLTKLVLAVLTVAPLAASSRTATAEDAALAPREVPAKSLPVRLTRSPPKTKTACLFTCTADATFYSPARRERPRQSRWPGWSTSR